MSLELEKVKRFLRRKVRYINLYWFFKRKEAYRRIWKLDRAEEADSLFNYVIDKYRWLDVNYPYIIVPWHSAFSSGIIHLLTYIPVISKVFFRSVRLFFYVLISLITSIFFFWNLRNIYIIFIKIYIIIVKYIKFLFYRFLKYWYIAIKKFFVLTFKRLLDVSYFFLSFNVFLLRVKNAIIYSDIEPTYFDYNKHYTYVRFKLKKRKFFKKFLRAISILFLIFVSPFLIFFFSFFFIFFNFIGLVYFFISYYSFRFLNKIYNGGIKFGIFVSFLIVCLIRLLFFFEMIILFLPRYFNKYFFKLIVLKNHYNKMIYLVENSYVPFILHIASRVLYCTEFLIRFVSFSYYHLKLNFVRFFKLLGRILLKVHYCKYIVAAFKRDSKFLYRERNIYYFYFVKTQVFIYFLVVVYFMYDNSFYIFEPLDHVELTSYKSVDFEPLEKAGLNIKFWVGFVRTYFYFYFALYTGVIVWLCFGKNLVFVAFPEFFYICLRRWYFGAFCLWGYFKLSVFIAHPDAASHFYTELDYICYDEYIYYYKGALENKVYHYLSYLADHVRVPISGMPCPKYFTYMYYPCPSTRWYHVISGCHCGFSTIFRDQIHYLYFPGSNLFLDYSESAYLSYKLRGDYFSYKYLISGQSLPNVKLVGSASLNTKFDSSMWVPGSKHAERWKYSWKQLREFNGFRNIPKGYNFRN